MTQRTYHPFTTIITDGITNSMKREESENGLIGPDTGEFPNIETGPPEKGLFSGSCTHWSSEDDSAIQEEKQVDLSHKVSLELANMDDHRQTQPKRLRQLSSTPSPQHNEVTNACIGDQSCYLGKLEQTQEEEEVLESSACDHISNFGLPRQTKDEKFSQLDAELDMLTTWYSDLEKDRDSISKLRNEAQHEASDLKRKYKDLVELNAGAKQEIESLCAEVKGLQDVHEEIFNLRHSYNEIQHSYRYLQSEYEILNKLNTETMRNIHEMEAETNALRKKLEACKDDLFRLQPTRHITDAEIVNDFESLSQHIHNWIEVELTKYEQANPEAQEKDFFSGDRNGASVKFLQRFPQAGEYLARYTIHRYIQEYMFADEVYLLGLSEEITDTLERAEVSMEQLGPPTGMYPTPNTLKQYQQAVDKIQIPQPSGIGVRKP